VNREVFDKPEEYYTLDKLRKAAAVDRRLTLREILEKIFGLIPRFKSKDELLEEEFAKFVADYKPDEAEAIPAIKTYFKAYVTSDQVRHIIESRTSPTWPPTPSSPPATSRPCPRSTARSSRNTSRTTSP
jgi:type I restriction enzyme, R subunit